MVQKSNTKRQPAVKKLKTPDKGNSPRNENASLTMLSNVCGDIIEEESKDTKEEIVSTKITAATPTSCMICLTLTTMTSSRIRKIRGRGSRKKTRRVETLPTDLTNKTTPVLTGTQQMGSKKEERKRRKRRSSRQRKKRTIQRRV